MGKLLCFALKEDDTCAASQAIRYVYIEPLTSAGNEPSPAQSRANRPIVRNPRKIRPMYSLRSPSPDQSSS